MRQLPSTRAQKLQHSRIWFTLQTKILLSNFTKYLNFYYEANPLMIIMLLVDMAMPLVIMAVHSAMHVGTGH